MLNFVGEEFAKAWLDFRFRRHRFLIHARDGLFRLFVRDPQCPDLILYQVGCHFERLLGEAGNGDNRPSHPIVEDARPAASQPIW